MKRTVNLGLVINVKPLHSSVSMTKSTLIKICGIISYKGFILVCDLLQILRVQYFVWCCVLDMCIESFMKTLKLFKPHRYA